MLYTAHKTSLVQALAPVFEKETGVKTEVVQLGSSEVTRRVRAEAKAPKADVIWSTTGSLLTENADLLEPYKPRKPRTSIRASSKAPPGRLTRQSSTC